LNEADCNKIINNKISENICGIKVSYSSTGGVNIGNVLEKNIIIANDVGIYLRHAQSVLIKNNIVENNQKEGIIICEGCDGVVIKQNTVKDNLREGVYVLYDQYDNHPYSYYSKSEITYTYKGNTYRNYLGNYWGNNIGLDEDNDGISDVAYADVNMIKIGKEDPHPLMKPFENYIIFSE